MKPNGAAAHCQTVKGTKGNPTSDLTDKAVVSMLGWNSDVKVHIRAPYTSVGPDFDNETLARFILVDNSMHRISSYVDRGRRFNGETLDSLMSQLLELLRKWALDPLGRPELRTINDIEAELDLRNVKRPYSVGQEEIEKIRLATLAFAKTLNAETRLKKRARLVKRYRAGRQRIA
jgi:hypothetical protein